MMNSGNRETRRRKCSLLLLFFLLLFSSALFAGCGKKTGKETQQESAETEAKQDKNTEPAMETQEMTDPMTEAGAEPAGETEEAAQLQTEAETKPAGETEEAAQLQTEAETEPALETEAGTAAETEFEENALYLSKEDFLACPAGTILEQQQINPFRLNDYFVSSVIDPQGEVFARMYGKSYKEDCTVPLEDLRYIKLLHYGFDGQIHVGELVVSSLIEQDILEIFRILYENRYEIEKMFLIDRYEADDTASIEVNNTSAFNFRLVTNGTKLSNHAWGCAIDINPQQNPYITFDEDGTPHWVHENADPYIDRSNPDWQRMHMITEDDLCFRLFAERGFTWGGSWNNPKDYQHFERIPDQSSD